MTVPPTPGASRLPGSSASGRRGTASEGQTFSDFEYHQQRRTTGNSAGTADAASSPYTRRCGAASSPRRWSFTLQDIPSTIRGTLNDVSTGYVARVGALVGVTLGVGWAVYHCLLLPSQERRPLAKRWSWCAPAVPITLLEKNREDGSDMYVYRFALPNSYDYAGYDPVSSVRMMSGRVRELSSLARWYTPISHPDQRGFIEFAIKDCDPGRMSARLRYLEPGDVVYLGRWMREFSYKPNTLTELGVVCTTSGASVALQLMNVLDKARDDATRLSILYCHHTAACIPFRKSLFKDYLDRNPDRIRISYNVLAGQRHKTGLAQEEHHVHIGNIDPETIAAALPPPIRVAKTRSAFPPDHGMQAPASTTYRPQLLICGPQSMLMYLCGRVSPIGNYTYWQGPFYRYAGFLKDMGYTRSQVYKFGVSTHFLADH